MFCAGLREETTVVFSVYGCCVGTAMDGSLVNVAKKLSRQLTSDLIKDTLSSRPTVDELKQEGVLRGKARTRQRSA